jgi:hypothetical protein
MASDRVSDTPTPPTNAHAVHHHNKHRTGSNNAIPTSDKLIIAQRNKYQYESKVTDSD